MKWLALIAALDVAAFGYLLHDRAAEARSMAGRVASEPLIVVEPAPQPVPSKPVYDSLEALVAARLTTTSTRLDALERQRRCLGQAVYFEARSEPLRGQLAVAQVVLNRVASDAYPNSICGVVFQNESWRHRCQFSFACDGRSDRPRNPRAWAVAVTVADIALDDAWADLTDQATHYHADYVQPRWRLAMINTVQHGRHLFYRDERVQQAANLAP